MTSVLNHLQPLNGNKVAGFVLVYALCSCNLFKTTTRVLEHKDLEKKDSVVVEKKGPIEVKEVAKPEPEEQKEVWFHGEKYQVQDDDKTFQVALILPFNSGSVTATDKKVGDIMFEYYQGFVTAIKLMETSGLKLKLSVYDSRSDSMALIRILNSRKLKESDLIIGPISEKYMGIVANYGRKNKIPVFSPFTPIEQLSDTNNLFYNFNISYKNKAVEMVKFIRKFHRNEKLFIVRDGKKYDKEFVPILITELKKYKIDFATVAFTNSNSWSTTLTSLGNLVYIPSLEKNVVSVTMGNIFSTRKPVSVLGEYKWIEFPNNDYSFWNELKVHLITNSYIDYLDSNTFEFRENYRLSYKKDPTDYAFTGFNQGKFVSEALLAFGDRFYAFINNRSLVYYGTCYNFVKMNGINQNRHLWILQFQDYKLVPIEY